MNLLPKTCPQCGAEYVHTMFVCTDCRVDLEVANLSPSVQPQLPPASELRLAAAGEPREMERMALELQRHGISSRIDSDQQSQRNRLGVYVAPEDAELAAQVIAHFILPHEVDALGALPAGTELDGCPACGAAVSETADTCADCGLVFVASEAR